MEHTWRWFGPSDPVTLADVRQTGATGIVTALHEIPNGEVWPVDDILARKAEIERAGLTWSVVESIPIHEDIKSGEPGCVRYVDAWAETVRNLGRCGIDTVCYNFMPVLDWTRTDLAHVLPDGSWALRFDHLDFAAFDLHLLRRAGAEADYSDADRAEAESRYLGMSEAARDTLVANVIAGLPGAEESYTLESLRRDVTRYDDIGPRELRANLVGFLRAVVPVAEQAGIRLAIHPDDPPRPLLGLPRVVSTAQDVRGIVGAIDSPANGLTFCTGSFGVRADNDLPAMAREFAPRIHFVHLRATRREADPRSFHEAVHIDGDVDMVGVVGELVREERRRERDGGARLPMRPDHGHRILSEQRSDRRSNPGYTLLGRMKGLAELRGVELVVRALSV